LNLEQGLEKRLKVRMEQASETGLLDRARPLFVCGCARSGTTAFGDYLNQHEEVLLCQERYKERQKQVAWEDFSFERIMDFRAQETKRPPFGQTREAFAERHAKLLAAKDPAKLRWLGDKGPFYVRSMDRLAGRNPGARFVVLYRPLEEVAESWDARAKDPDDPWRDERGVEMSVEVWNAAMQKTREFIESSPAPRVLVIGYHDFFYRNEAVAPQISRFLGLEFDESITNAWREASSGFESRRRRKEPLSEEQRSFLREYADHEAEAWVLSRIEQQWISPELYVEEGEKAVLSSLDRIEARMWRLHEQVENRPKQRGKNLERQLGEARSSEKRRVRQVEELRERNHNLERQLRETRSSKTWRILDGINRLKKKVLRPFRRGRPGK
jgi:hypothetical protein